MHHKQCVLVIEPDLVMRRRICTLLEELGCETRVISREDVREGVAWGCDLVLWAWDDWSVWLGSGEILWAERQLPCYPRVVLLTRNPDECLWIQALRVGAFDLIEEPHSPDAMREFRRVVGAALGVTPEVPVSTGA